MKDEKIPREEKLVEAIRRMQMLALDEEVIKRFVEDGTVPLFIHNMDDTFGIHRSKLDRLEAFEQDSNALVYAVIFVATSLGDMESYLFVSDYGEEWEMDNDDLKDGYPMTWTNNLTYPECSEYGSISITTNDHGGLKRVG